MMSRSTILRLQLTIWNNNVPNMNNNNNQSPMMQMRDRLFQVMFIKLSIGYAKVFPQLFRNLIENFILFLALMSLFMLAYVHITFVHEPMNCLDSVQKEWPREGILRIEVIQKFDKDSYSLQKSYEKELTLRLYQGYAVPHLDANKNSILPDSETNDNVGSEMDEGNVDDGISAYTFEDDLLTANSTSDLLLNEDDSILSFSSWLKQGKVNDSKQFASEVNEGFGLTTGKSDNINNFWEDGTGSVYIVEYSLEYGFLKLSLAARKQFKIPVKLVVLDPEVDKCFGSWFTKAVLDNILGYDDVLLASLSKLASEEENKGFIRNVATEHYFRFVNVMNHSSYFVAAVVMLSFTFFISTLLRYSHHQIFIFILQVLRLFELRATTTIPVASLMAVILALVGMEAIMSEFFSDPATSFYVILIVWIADQFDAICCRTIISRRHWLKFFFLYHFAFYAYDYRFSGQYSDLALFTSCSFIFHSMMYFFHHYELPAILRTLDQHNNHHHDHHPNPNHRPSAREPVVPESDASTGSLENNLLPESEQDASPPEPGASEENNVVDGPGSPDSDNRRTSSGMHLQNRSNTRVLSQDTSSRVVPRGRRHGVIHNVGRPRIGVDTFSVHCLRVYEDVGDSARASDLRVPKLSELCIREYGLRKFREKNGSQRHLFVISR